MLERKMDKYQRNVLKRDVKDNGVSFLSNVYEKEMRLNYQEKIILRLECFCCGVK